MVDVRNTGVSTMPHSCAVRKPVHSPAPFRTAPPAETGRRNVSIPGISTVTPVRATPRPSGGSGSSRHTVAWPRPTPGTSRTLPLGPDGRLPILIARSAARGMRSSCRTTLPDWRTVTGVHVPFVWAEDVLLHEPEAEIWVGVRTPATELPGRAVEIRQALMAAG